jgi:hypothetical protein
MGSLLRSQPVGFLRLKSSGVLQFSQYDVLGEELIIPCNIIPCEILVTRMGGGRAAVQTTVGSSDTWLTSPCNISDVLSSFLK